MMRFGKTARQGNRSGIFKFTLPPVIPVILIEKNKLSLTPLFFFLIILSLSRSAHSEGINNQSCSESSIAIMLNEIETIRQGLRGKAVGPAVDVSDVARKYIRVDCELAQVLGYLTSAGFKVSKARWAPLTTWVASIPLKKEWWNLTSIELLLTIEHKSERVKLVTATIFYGNF